MAVQSKESTSELREKHPRVVLGKGGSGSRVMHIPNGEGGALCKRPMSVTKDVEVFPPGYLGWCEECVRISDD